MVHINIDIYQSHLYKLIFIIGYGSSAIVYEAMYKPLKKKVAVKMIDLDMFERNQIDELRVKIDDIFRNEPTDIDFY